MQPLNAVVKNGRLTLDEPTDLPEGQVVVLLSLEEILASAEEVGSHDDGPAMSLMLAPREWKAPPVVDARALLDELRSM